MPGLLFLMNSNCSSNKRAPGQIDLGLYKKRIQKDYSAFNSSRLLKMFFVVYSVTSQMEVSLEVRM